MAQGCWAICPTSHCRKWHRAGILLTAALPDSAGGSTVHPFSSSLPWDPLRPSQVILALERSLPLLEEALPSSREVRRGEELWTRSFHPRQYFLGCAPGQILTRRNVLWTSAPKGSGSGAPHNKEANSCKMQSLHPGSFSVM